MKRSLSTSLQSLLDRPWPDQIPKQCPKCSEPMNKKINLFIGLSRLAMRLKHIAPWTSLIVLATVVAIMAFAPPNSIRGLGQGSPMALVAMIVAPPLILTIIANGLPKKYKLQCQHCQLQTDYSLEKNIQNPAPKEHS